MSFIPTTDPQLVVEYTYMMYPHSPPCFPSVLCCFCLHSLALYFEKSLLICECMLSKILFSFALTATFILFFILLFFRVLFSSLIYCCVVAFVAVAFVVAKCFSHSAFHLPLFTLCQLNELLECCAACIHIYAHLILIYIQYIENVRQPATAANI